MNGFTDVALAGLIYAALSLDHIAVGPFLLSRPVVAGALIGLFLGNGPLGFSAGLVAELLFLSVPPVGLRSSNISIIGGLAALWSVQAYAQRDAALVISLILASLCGWGVTRVEAWARRQNDRFGGWVQDHLKEGRERVLWKAFALWMGLWFLKAWAFFVALGVLGQSAVDAALRTLPLHALEKLDAGAGLLPAACFASAAAYFWGRVRPVVEEKP